MIKIIQICNEVHYRDALYPKIGPPSPHPKISREFVDCLLCRLASDPRIKEDAEQGVKDMAFWTSILEKRSHGIFTTTTRKGDRWSDMC